jgi:peptidoglycan/LPS O-acetylase OafA/YrhL
MWTGGRSVAAYWAVAVGQLSWLVGGVIAPQPDDVGVILGTVNVLILYGPLILFRPHRRELLHPHVRPGRVVLGIAVVAAVPLCLFAWHLRTEVSGELGFDMVGLYVALAAGSLLAALRPRRSQWLSVAVATAAALVGAAAILRPNDQASPGILGGLLLLCWALTLLLMTRGRSEPRPAV